MLNLGKILLKHRKRAGTGSPPRWLVPSVPCLVFLCCFLFVLSTGPTWMFGDGDLGWHLRVGRDILNEGRIPTADTLSWTAPGAPWVDIQWGTEVWYALVLERAGFLGLLVIHAAILALVFALISQTALAAGAEVITTILLTGAAFYLTSIHWFVRPHLQTWLLTALWCNILFRQLRTEGRSAWLIPLLTPLWVNLHGGWPTGCLTLFLFALGDVLAGPGRLTRSLALKWIAIGSLTALMTLANPYGPQAHSDVLQMVGAKPILDITEEWQSPDFRGNAWHFKWMFLLGLGSLAFVPSRWKALGFGLFLTGTQMFMVSVRHIPIFLIWTTPIVALSLTEAWTRLAGLIPAGREAMGRLLDRQQAGSHRWLGAGGGVWAALAVGLALAGLFPPALQRGAAGFSADTYPVAAAVYLQEHRPEGRMFNDYSWGGYVAYALPKGFPIFIDGRNVMYGAQINIDWLTLTTLGSGWERVLNQYDFSWTLLPTDSLLSRTLEQRQWRVHYQDSTATVLIRPADPQQSPDAAQEATAGSRSQDSGKVSTRD